MAMKLLLYILLQIVTLRGVVTDESGAIVPGATVTLTSNTGAANTTVTSGDGSYSIAVSSGDYIVQASAPDLKTGPVKVSIRSGVQVLNLQLKVTLAGQD